MSDKERSQGTEYLTFSGQTIGEINHATKEYITQRSFEKHFFGKFNGFGLSFQVLDKLDKCGVEKIIILLVDKRKELETTLSKFIVHGLEYRDNSKGKEETQLILPIQYFNQKVKQEIQVKL